MVDINAKSHTFFRASVTFLKFLLFQCQFFEFFIPYSLQIYYKCTKKRKYYISTWKPEKKRFLKRSTEQYYVRNGFNCYPKYLINADCFSNWIIKVKKKPDIPSLDEDVLICFIIWSISKPSKIIWRAVEGKCCHVC